MPARKPRTMVRIKRETRPRRLVRKPSLDDLKHEVSWNSTMQRELGNALKIKNQEKMLERLNELLAMQKQAIEEHSKHGRPFKDIVSAPLKRIVSAMAAKIYSGKIFRIEPEIKRLGKTIEQNVSRKKQRVEELELTSLAA